MSARTVGLDAYDQPAFGRGRLQPRRGVDHIAGRQRLPLRGAEHHDRFACVDGRPRGEREAVLDIEGVEASENPEPGADRAFSVVAVRGRRAEDGHHGVADELLDHPSVLLDVPLRLRVVQLLRLAHVLGVGAVGAGREPDEVDEQDRDELPLRARLRRVEPRTAARAEPRSGQVRGAARRAQRFALPDHASSLAAPAQTYNRSRWRSSQARSAASLAS